MNWFATYGRRGFEPGFEGGARRFGSQNKSTIRLYPDQAELVETISRKIRNGQNVNDDYQTLGQVFQTMVQQGDAIKVDAAGRNLPDDQQGWNDALLDTTGRAAKKMRKRKYIEDEMDKVDPRLKTSWSDAPLTILNRKWRRTESERPINAQNRLLPVSGYRYNPVPRSSAETAARDVIAMRLQRVRRNAAARNIQRNVVIGRQRRRAALEDIFNRPDIEAEFGD